VKSAANVCKNLAAEKYDVRSVFISKKGKWEVSPKELRKFADVAFIALHGEYGEDGGVQADLEEAGIPYTGSASAASALAMNKFLTLRLFKEQGLGVPLSLLVTTGEWNADPDAILDRVRYRIQFPAVVKPNRDGSSVGVHIVTDSSGLVQALLNIFAFSREALVQPLITGREFTCGVLDHGFPASASPLLPTEIVPQVSSFFDYRAKYEPGGSLEITPPENLPDAVVDSIRRTAVTAHRLVGARGFSRTDMFLTPQGELYVLEINTIPGLTEQSLLPKAAAVSGISFSELLNRVIEAALAR
jgi:D-alanine-D-alanine ligase